MGQAMATAERGCLPQYYGRSVCHRHSRIHQLHEDDPRIFEMIKTRLEPHLARQATNYRAPISVGEKLALTIRYLATGESYTSLSCQFRVGRSTISKFLPEVCRAIQDEFTREYLKCPTTPDEWKELEREFRIRWNVPHALGALDGKHVALKKPQNTGAL